MLQLNDVTYEADELEKLEAIKPRHTFRWRVVPVTLEAWIHVGPKNIVAGPFPVVACATRFEELSCAGVPSFVPKTHDMFRSYSPIDTVTEEDDEYERLVYSLCVWLVCSPLPDTAENCRVNRWMSDNFVFFSKVAAEHARKTMQGKPVSKKHEPNLPIVE